MEMIVPVPLQLDYDYTAALSVYPTWNSSTAYPKYSRVRDTADGRDYEAQYYFSPGGTRPSEYIWWGWENIGVSGNDNFEAETSAEYTNYATWTYGNGVSKGEVQMDLADRNDYVANVAISSGSNTTRPSTAVLSDDPTLSGYWTLVGTSNAFRMFDGSVLTKTSADSALTCTASAVGLCDRITFTGLSNVKTVDVTVNAGEKLPNPSFTSSSMSGWSGYLFTKNSGSVSLSTTGQINALQDMIPGRNYTLSATFNSNTGQFYISHRAPDWSSKISETVTTNASGTVSFTFTATMNVELMVFSASTGSVVITDVSLKESGFTQENLSTDLEYTEGSQYKSVCKLTHTAVDSPQYIITLESEYLGNEILCGLAAAGTAIELGCVEINVTDTTDDYSLIKFDETYGTATLVQRGFSRVLSLRLLFLSGTSAYAHHRLRNVRAIPCFWDLNGVGMDDDGLKLLGIAHRPQRNVTGINGTETIRLELKGLTE